MVHVVTPYPQSKAEARRTATWQRHPTQSWRCQHMATLPSLAPSPKVAAAHRRLAICRLMDENGVPNSERAHRRAYGKLWTGLVRQRLGPPPHPRSLVRWRRKLAAADLHAALREMIAKGA